MLFQIVADNLGLHGAYGLKKSFRGQACCRVCKSNRIKTSVELGEMKTVEEYEAVVGNGNLDVMEANGIREKCAFHDLTYYHFIKAPTLDLMHDVLEGHAHYLLAHVFNELRRQFRNVPVNGLIETFVYKGKVRQNKPTALQLLTVNARENGSRLQGYTAKKTLNLLRLLPLIMESYGIHPTGPFWTCLLDFLYIMDYLLAKTMPQANVDVLRLMIEKYVASYILAGGYMTIKTHHLLHYVDVIEKLGMPTFYWSMRFEANHQTFKRYGNTNCCHKSLANTLANKIQRRSYFQLQELIEGKGC